MLGQACHEEHYVNPDPNHNVNFKQDILILSSTFQIPKKFARCLNDRNKTESDCLQILSDIHSTEKHKDNICLFVLFFLPH